MKCFEWLVVESVGRMHIPCHMNIAPQKFDPEATYVSSQNECFHKMNLSTAARTMCVLLVTAEFPFRTHNERTLSRTLLGLGALLLNEFDSVFRVWLALKLWHTLKFLLFVLV